VQVVTRFDVPDSAAEQFQEQAGAALAVLAGSAGFVRGRLGRAVDAPSRWALLTEWDSTGAYRRALGSYDMKVAAAPIMAFSIPEPGAYAVVQAQDQAQAGAVPPSNRAR
jgi:hypothetical protein